MSVIVSSKDSGLATRHHDAKGLGLWSFCAFFAMTLFLFAACGQSDPASSPDGDAENESALESEREAEREAETEAETEDVELIAGIPANHPLLTGKFRNIAHRGGAKLMPEETLLAYDNAVAAGADMLEMDLHASKDGMLVLNHDATLERTTDGTGNLKDHSWSELQTLDAAYTFTKDGGASFPLRGTGVRMTTFETVLTRYPQAYFSVEIKQSEPSIVDAVLALLAETGMEERVILISFSDTTMKEVRKKNPRIVTGASLTEMVKIESLSEAKLDDYVLPCPIFQMSSADAALVHKIRHFGARLQVWTINEAPKMRDFLTLGVDGIITDDPVLLHGVLTESSR